MPAPNAGASSNAVLTAITLRPPAMAIRKAFGMRSVAPVSPATAVKVKSWEEVKGKSRFFIWTVMIDQ